MRINNREIYSDMLSECGSELSITDIVLNNSRRCHRTGKIFSRISKCILEKSEQINEEKVALLIEFRE